MNIFFAGMIGGWEMVVIAGVVLMMFGARKIPEFMKGLGTGIKEFKKATREMDNELQQAMHDDPPAPRKLPPANTQASPTDSSAETPAQKT